MPTTSTIDRLPPVHVSLGAYGRLPHLLAIAAMLKDPPRDPLLGPLSPDHVQVCPQNLGLLDREVAAELKATFPGIRFRLHANVQVMRQRCIVDLCDWREQQPYFRELATVSAALGAPVYSAHAGKRDKASVRQVLDYVRSAAQLFGCPVAVEGHYPTPRNAWLFSSWEEYRLLLESRVPYALDLSHLNIVAVQSGRLELALVQELMAGENCLEVHLSGNDGTADQHVPLNPDCPPWWLSLLTYVNPLATLFSEGRVSQEWAAAVQSGSRASCR